MIGIDRLPTLSDTPFGAGQFVGVWTVAAATYGLGDTVTTIAVVRGAAAGMEANPVVDAVIAYGEVPSFFVLKLAAFLVCLALGLGAGRRADHLGFHASPATLAVLGAFASTVNVLLLAC